MRSGFAAALVLLCSYFVRAQLPASAPEYNVKAGYLLLFARYVTWPEGIFPSPDTPIVVGILGWDPFGRVIDETFKGMQIQGRKIEVRRVPSAALAKACQVVFICRSEARRQAVWLDTLSRLPILIVTENESEIPSESVINFVVEGNRLQFDVNLKAVKNTGLKIMSPMLVSAHKLKPETEGK